jgi:hypothetical protein
MIFLNSLKDYSEFQTALPLPLRPVNMGCVLSSYQPSSKTSI